MKILTALLALACTLAAMPAGAQSATPDRLEGVLKNGTLRVGTTMDTPVFSMRNASGQLEGFDMDALETLGKALGVKIEYVKMTFGTMLSASKSGSMVPKVIFTYSILTPSA